MTLFHPGATISLVVPRLAKRFEQRLEETSGLVNGVTGSPVKIKGILRINLDVGGCTGQLTVRAVEDIGHEIVLGMDFGLELDIHVQLKVRRWKCGEKGEWYDFIQLKEDSSTAILA